MNDTIYKDYMTRNYQNYINMMNLRQSKRTAANVESSVRSRSDSRFETAEGDSFQDVVSRYTEASGVSEAALPLQRSTRDMSMEEYKAYIADRISRLSMHPSQMQDSVSIYISEAGFKAMKEDPEYEEWVIDWLGQDFAFNNPWAGICGGRYVVHYVGATKEEYRGQSWYPEYQNGKGKSLFDQKSEGCFWQRRMDRHREYQKLHQKKVQSEALQARLLQRQLQQFSAFDLQNMSGQPPFLIAQLLLGGISGGDVNI